MKTHINKITILIAGTLLMLTNSCELTDDLLGNETISKIVGDWDCEENSEYFKKSTKSSYTVYISPDADNDYGILIDGFYNLGDVGVKAVVYGNTITISEQVVQGGYVILSGTGLINNNKNQITWEYRINIGGSAIDDVTAIYTR
ncbi:MAG: hypothetical protein JXA72_09745 [Bacteroidales bacterium]|nr:hypothetical protein [Bacteroidales bacterium]